MKESGEVLYESGHVVDVTVVTLGDELDGDHADGATTLTVGDAVDFDEGGMVLIDGTTYDVTAVDDDANTITISPGLTDALDDGESVDVWDPLYSAVSSYKAVQVRVQSEDSNEDIVEAVLMSHLVDKLDEGIRGVHGESVLLECDGDEWRVVDVLGFGDPDSFGSTVLFYQDSITVSAPGDQTVSLTFEPIVNSEHVYWNGLYQPGSEWTRSGQIVTVLDAGDLIQADDILVVEYAYRHGVTREDPEVPNPWVFYPEGEPDLDNGVGTTGPEVLGIGDVWIDGDQSTGVVLYAVDNALGRDTATIQLPGRTGLPVDATGLQLRCYLTIADAGTNPFQNLYVRVQDGASAVQALGTTSVTGEHSFVLTSLDLDDFLDDMNASHPVYMVVLVDYGVAPVGEEGVMISEIRIELEEV